LPIATIGYEYEVERENVFHRIGKDRKLTVCGLEIHEIADEAKYPGYRMCKRCK
jgi:methylphosphotriester-DNA--protein-cysteine methyltransferase